MVSRVPHRVSEAQDVPGGHLITLGAAKDQEEAKESVFRQFKASVKRFRDSAEIYTAGKSSEELLKIFKQVKF